MSKNEDLENTTKNNNLWKCACEQNFIRPKVESCCFKCGILREDGEVTSISDTLKEFWQSIESSLKGKSG